MWVLSVNCLSGGYAMSVDNEREKMPLMQHEAHDALWTYRPFVCLDWMTNQ